MAQGLVSAHIVFSNFYNCAPHPLINVLYKTFDKSRGLEKLSFPLNKTNRNKSIQSNLVTYFQNKFWPIQWLIAYHWKEDKMLDQMSRVDITRESHTMLILDIRHSKINTVRIQN